MIDEPTPAKRRGSSRIRGMRLTLLGIGAMNSPRYGPAGLLVESGKSRVMIDGGPKAVARGKLDAWLVSDERCELMSAIRALSRDKGTEPRVGAHRSTGLRIVPKPVIHTSHPTYGYSIEGGGSCVVWAPEFWEFPPVCGQRRSDVRRSGRLEPADPLRERDRRPCIRLRSRRTRGPSIE